MFWITTGSKIYTYYLSKWLNKDKFESLYMYVIYITNSTLWWVMNHYHLDKVLYMCVIYITMSYESLSYIEPYLTFYLMQKLYQTNILPNTSDS